MKSDEDIRLMIKRGLAYALLTTVWILVAGLASFLLGPCEIEFDRDESKAEMTTVLDKEEYITDRIGKDKPW